METTSVSIPTNIPARDAEGFLVDSDEWTREVAQAIATEIGIGLTPQHWVIVDAARKEFKANAASPGLRKLSKATGLPIKAFYDLFPDGPAKKIAKVAGIPKPKSCL